MALAAAAARPRVMMMMIAIIAALSSEAYADLPDRISSSSSSQSSSPWCRPERPSEYGGPEELDLDRWRVGSSPAMAAARRDRKFGSYRFNVSDGAEAFVLNFAMAEGVPWPQPVDAALYAQAHRDVRLRPRDVVVASYPKSGTTWTEQIVLLLLHGSRVAHLLKPETRNTYSETSHRLGKVWLEPTIARRGRQQKQHPPLAAVSANHTRGEGSSPAVGSEESSPLSAAAAAFDRIPSPRVIKSHAPFEMLMGVPRGEPGTAALDRSGAKVVYVARNAKDAAVSLFFQRAPVSTGPSARQLRAAVKKQQQHHEYADVAASTLHQHDMKRKAFAERSSAPNQGGSRGGRGGGRGGGRRRRLPRRQNSPLRPPQVGARRGLLSSAGGDADRLEAASADRSAARASHTRAASTTRRSSARRMPMDAWAALYLSGHMSCGSYFDHVATWHAASRASPNVLFVTYEELKADPLGSIRRLAAFLELDRDDDELAKVANASSLDAMKKKASSGSSKSRSGGASSSRSASLRASRYNIPPGAKLADVNASASTHLRQGEVGSWRAYFGATLSAQFDAVYAAEMRRAAGRATAKFGGGRHRPSFVMPRQRRDGSDDGESPPRFDFGCGVVM